MPAAWIERRGTAVALVLAALAAALRAWGLGTYWVNPDEGIYYSMALWSDPAKFWAELAGNAHPPLYYLLLRGMAAVGQGFVWLRSLSVVAGSIAVFAVFLLGREAAGRGVAATWTGLVAAAFLALSPAAVTMSRLMRPYMVQLASLTLALWFLTRWHRGRRGRDLFLYAAALLVALLTHYGSLLALAGIGTALLVEAAAGRFTGRDRRALALAHLLPILTVFALYWFHIRTHLVGSAVVAEALATWIRPYLIATPADVWRRLTGFLAFLAGSELGGVATLGLAAGLACAVWRRRWLLLGLSLPFLAAALAAAAAGRYPFGCSRHSSWLLAPMALPLAFGLGTALAAGRRAAALAGIAAAALVVGRAGVGAVVGAAPVRPFPERILAVADLDAAAPVFAAIEDRPGVVLMTLQCYYVLLPRYARAREAAVQAGDGSFFRFRWGASDVVVMNQWELSIDPRDRGRARHLYTFVTTVDREMPDLGLGRRRDAILLFGGWSVATPLLMVQADLRLPPAERLISERFGAPGFYAFRFDVGRYVEEVRRDLRRKR